MAFKPEKDCWFWNFIYFIKTRFFKSDVSGIHSITKNKIHTALSKVGIDIVEHF